VAYKVYTLPLLRSIFPKASEYPAGYEARKAVAFLCFAVAKKALREAHFSQGFFAVAKKAF